MKTADKVLLTYKNKSHYVFIFKYTVGTFLIFVLAFVLLKFPDSSANGIGRGIDLCFNVLIPTLYPFMILTNVFVHSGLATVKIPLVFKICEYIFRLPGECISVIIFSMVGGLPVGTKMALELYKKGVLSKEESRRLMYFCVNAGPAFIISTVGHYMLGSTQMGVLIYISLILSSLTIGFLTRFITDGSITYITENMDAEREKGNFFRVSVLKSSAAIFQICIWVVVFSCINSMISLLDIPESMRLFLNCISEMTSASETAADCFPVPVVAGVIGFSGLCGHFQLMDSFSAVDMKYKHFLVSRIVSGSLAVIYCNFLLKLFPVVSETFCAGVKPTESDTSGSALISVLMILMAALFIVGDDYTIRKKNKKI